MFEPPCKDEDLSPEAPLTPLFVVKSRLSSLGFTNFMFPWPGTGFLRTDPPFELRFGSEFISWLEGEPSGFDTPRICLFMALREEPNY